MRFENVELLSLRTHILQSTRLLVLDLRSSDRIDTVRENFGLVRMTCMDVCRNRRNEFIRIAYYLQFEKWPLKFFAWFNGF
jgi:hypothetical protein